MNSNSEIGLGFHDMSTESTAMEAQDGGSCISRLQAEQLRRKGVPAAPARGTHEWLSLSPSPEWPFCASSRPELDLLWDGWGRRKKMRWDMRGERREFVRIRGAAGRRPHQIGRICRMKRYGSQCGFHPLSKTLETPYKRFVAMKRESPLSS